MRRPFQALCLAACAAVMSLPAMADTYSLGNLSLSSPVSRTHTFSVSYEGCFTDYFNFSINTPSRVSGTTTEDDGYLGTRWNFHVLDIDVSSVSLARKNSHGQFVSLRSDSTPEQFSFASLAGGDYRLIVNGRVTERNARSSLRGADAPSYTLTASAAPIASATPEASDLAMTVLGLAGIGFWTRRSKKA